MPEFSTTRRVKHAASEMFDLVADVEDYPQFVPLCRSLEVRKRVIEDDGAEVIIADMTVAYKLLSEAFRSKVTLRRAQRQILVEYLRGPFSHMRNRWEFLPLGEKECEVKFYITYEFKSRMLAMVMGAVFETAFRRFAAAFEARADQVYGRNVA